MQAHMLRQSEPDPSRKACPITQPRPNQDHCCCLRNPYAISEFFLITLASQESMNQLAQAAMKLQKCCKGSCRFGGVRPVQLVATCREPLGTAGGCWGAVGPAGGRLPGAAGNRWEPLGGSQASWGAFAGSRWEPLGTAGNQPDQLGLGQASWEPLAGNR